jgi:hypothetical protein
MQTPEEIIQALGQLDPATFETVITNAYRQRQDPIGSAAQERPGPGTEPEQFAQWLAKRHLSSDAAIERVVYLPTGAPNNEIRMLEVNRFLRPPDDDVIEPLDFSPDIDDLPFKVFVADVTSDQWERIKRQPDTTLPPDWKLEDHRIYSRG